MTLRTRKLVGAFALIAVIIGYALLAMAVAVVLQVNGAGKLVELTFYVVAGLLWTLPAGAIIAWMSRP